MIEIKLNSECNYIHLLSGGLDSAYSILSRAKELKEIEPPIVIQPIFFDYGHYSAKIELARVKKIVRYIRRFFKNKSIIAEPTKISLRSDLFTWSRSDAFKGKEGDKNPEIENRNMVLFSVLASYLIACANNQNISSTTFEITSGFKEKELPDCKSAFFEKIKDLLRVYNKDRKYPKNLTFNFPILPCMERQTIIDKTKELLNNDETELKKFLKLTTSCYSPNNKGEPCYECSKCESLRDEKMKSTYNKVERRFSI